MIGTLTKTISFLIILSSNSYAALPSSCVSYPISVSYAEAHTNIKEGVATSKFVVITRHAHAVAIDREGDTYSFVTNYSVFQVPKNAIEPKCLIWVSIPPQPAKIKKIDKETGLALVETVYTRKKARSRASVVPKRLEHHQRNSATVVFDDLSTLDTQKISVNCTYEPLKDHFVLDKALPVQSMGAGIFNNVTGQLVGIVHSLVLDANGKPIRTIAIKPERIKRILE